MLINFIETYEEARKHANDFEASSADKEQLGKGCRKPKQKKFIDDETFLEEEIHSLPQKKQKNGKKENIKKPAVVKNIKLKSSKKISSKQVNYF